MTAHSLLTTFEHDVNVSRSEKAACFKLLRTVLKNLAQSPEEPKYRQLRLGNTKIQTMTRNPSILMYLQTVVGFQQQQGVDGEAVLRIPENVTVYATAMQAAYNAVNASYERLAPSESTHDITTTTISSKPVLQRQSSSTLSEKQKARLLAEEKAAAEKEEARLARKRTSHQIKMDKYVRENDPNWKPSVSAAAAKAGDKMTTFRDKYGES